MKKRKPLRRRSEKTAKLYAEQRVPLVIKILRERPRCEAALEGCTGRSTEVNEIVRRGQWKLGILVESNLQALCHTCHSWITDHPAEAHRLGFQKSRWEVEDG
jgi:hypothetical protein